MKWKPDDGYVCIQAGWPSRKACHAIGGVRGCPQKSQISLTSLRDKVGGNSIANGQGRTALDDVGVGENAALGIDIEPGPG